MVKIIYVEPGGERVVVDAEPGGSVMEAAIRGNVRGITADCGGSCACGTCRIYVDAPWRAGLGAIGAMERDMLDIAEDDESGLRLSCQIPVADTLDGLVVRVADVQG